MVRFILRIALFVAAMLAMPHILPGIEVEDEVVAVIGTAGYSFFEDRGVGCNAPKTPVNQCLQVTGSDEESSNIIQPDRLTQFYSSLDFSHFLTALRSPILCIHGLNLFQASEMTFFRGELS